jgi:LPXTG-motif cell wall-anchored protein
VQAKAPDIPSTQVIVERPERGLARGQYAWPDWAIAAVGLGGILAALILLLFARRRRARSRSGS